MSRAVAPRQVKTTTRIRPHGIHAYGQESVFSRVGVADRQRMLVVKHGGRIGEVNTVLPYVRRGFASVPFKVHDLLVYAQQCIRASSFCSSSDHQGAADRGFDLAAYSAGVVRELPGDDVEFGFPRSAQDREARPENRAIAGFLAGGAPYAVHGSLHGTAFSPGPWFLIEAGWADRTTAMRARLRERVREMDYLLFDPDRGGEKGFTRIDEGFTTRPDSGAMRRHFLDRGDPETAALFRPSSMEHVRSLGGDPLTFVSEDAALPAAAAGSP